MRDAVGPERSVADPADHDVAEVIDPAAGVAVAAGVDRPIPPVTVAMAVSPMAVTVPEMAVSEVAVSEVAVSEVAMAVRRRGCRPECAEGSHDEEREELAGTEHVDLLCLGTGIRS